MSKLEYNVTNFEYRINWVMRISGVNVAAFVYRNLISSDGGVFVCNKGFGLVLVGAGISEKVILVGEWGIDLAGY